MVTDWAAHVIPPAKLNIEAEDYPLDDYPTTRRVVTELVEVSTTIGDGGDPAEHAFLVEIGLPGEPAGAAGDGTARLRPDRAPRYPPPDVHRPRSAQFCRLLADQAGIVLGAAQLAETLEEQHLATVAALAAALEAKDAYTGGHAHTIAEFAVPVGEELGLSGRDLKPVRMGALLHDVGKIGIPEAILNKPGPADRRGVRRS